MWRLVRMLPFPFDSRNMLLAMSPTPLSSQRTVRFVSATSLRKRGVFVSASGVRSIWLRHDLVNFKSRLKALEAKVAEDGIVLTEAQVQALEEEKLDDEA